MTTAIPRVCRVFVNDVEVGALTPEEYKSLVAQVKSDRLTYLFQAANYVEVLLRLLIDCCKLMPVLVLALIALLVFGAPESTTQMLVTAPGGSVGVIRFWLGVAAFSSAFITLINTAGTARWPGHINMFDRKINRRIRQLLEVPAEGDVRVEEVAKEMGDE